MYTKTAVMTARSVLVAAAAVASLLIAGNVAAKDRTVTVAIHVSAQGLHLSQPADARKFYFRLQLAATVACASYSSKPEPLLD
jgi:UrcA family protein